MDLFEPVLLSRIQFAVTAMFHILWPPLSIGLAVFLVSLEIMWLKTKDPIYYQHFRFWTRLFLASFAVGVASGIPLEFAFGMNWGPFSAAVGHFFGQVLGFEGTMAFMLEAAFLSIMAFGWKRVPAGLHFLSTVMVALGSSLSAFWIMAANSWMQSPAGGHMENGHFVVTDFWAAVFNHDLVYGFSHMYVACLQTTIFAVGGLSAFYILKNRHTAFFLVSLKAAMVAALIMTPLQALIGDESGRAMAKIQPAKLAATESHWNTNAPGQGASWALVAWPDPENERNLFEITIPYGLSLLITHSPTGTVQGLKDFPKEDRPPIVLPFYAFRIMVGIGFAMIGLAALTAYIWRKGGMTPQAAPLQKPLLYAWMAFMPLAWTAIEMGWITREVGRQPWIVQGLIRVGDGASALPPATVATSLVAFLAIYGALFAVFCLAAARIVKSGPDLSPPDIHTPGAKA